MRGFESMERKVKGCAKNEKGEKGVNCARVTARARQGFGSTFRFGVVW